MRMASAAVGWTVFLLSAANPSMAWTKTLLVANNGTDGPTCGSRSEPCRSISMAIAVADAGDRILVGPGVYGDVNADGDFNDDGDENSEPCNCMGFGCNCMITLSKPITLESTDGASSTIIDLGYLVGGQMVAVNISANDVTFGSRRAGFHVTSRELATQAASGTPRALAGVVVEDQTARAQIRGNLVTEAVDGFSISGIDAELTDNTAGNNARDGFRLVGEKSVVRRNSSINNIGAGFTVQGSAHRIGLNSAIGNRTCGIVSGSGELDIPAVITKNNIFGNGTLVPELDNCGLRNTTSHALTATNNFWGADTGPGPDPADEVLGDINATTVFPVASLPFPVGGFR